MTLMPEPLPPIISLDALYRGDYDEALAANGVIFPMPMTIPSRSIPITITSRRNTMKIRALIDAIDDSPLQIGDVELALQVEKISSTNTVARLIAVPATPDGFDADGVVTLIEHTQIEGTMLAVGLEPNGAPALGEPHEAERFGILLEYPEGPRIVFRFATREEAQKHLDATLTTMHPLPEHRDVRWRNARVVEVSA